MPARFQCGGLMRLELLRQEQLGYMLRIHLSRIPDHGPTPRGLLWPPSRDLAA
jgi:hypothetical protein